MADDLVDRNAHTFWEIHIVERRRIAVPGDASLVANPVEFVRRDSWFQKGCRVIEDLASELIASVSDLSEGSCTSGRATHPADLAHPFNLLRIQLADFLR